MTNKSINDKSAQDWQENQKQIDEYFAYLKKIAQDKLYDVQDAKFAYTPIPVEFDSDIQKFTPADIPNLASILADKSFIQFASLSGQRNARYGEKIQAIDAAAPQESNFKKQANYAVQQAKWSANKVAMETFFADFKTAFDQIFADRLKEDDQYAFQKVELKHVLNGQIFAVTDNDAYNAYESYIKTLTTSDAFDAAEKQLEADKTSAFNAIKSQDTPNKPFFSPMRRDAEVQNYNKALDAAKQFYGGFKTRLDAIKAEKSKADDAHAYQTFVWYIPPHTDKSGKSWGFTSGDENKLDTLLADAQEDVFEWLEKLDYTTLLNDKLSIHQNLKEPVKSDFFLESNWQTAHDAWEKEKQDITSFFLLFPAAVDDIKQKKIDDDNKAAWKPLKGVDLSYFATMFTYEWKCGQSMPDPNELVKLAGGDTQTLDIEITEAKNSKQGILDQLTKDKPEQSAFHFESNYQASLTAWQADYDKISQLRTDVIKNLSDALALAKNPNAGQQANQASAKSNYTWILAAWTADYNGQSVSFSAGKPVDYMQLAKFPMKALVDFEKEVDQLAKDNEQEINLAEPANGTIPPDVYDATHQDWEENKAQNAAFWADVKSALKTAKCQIQGADSGYKWIKVFFQYTSGGAQGGGISAGGTLITWDETHLPTVEDVKKLGKFSELNIISTLFFTTHKKTLEEAMAKQTPDPALSADKKSLFKQAQDENLNRLKKFFHTLSDIFKQAMGIKSSGANGKSSASLYKWVDFYWEYAYNGTTHTAKTAESVDYFDISVMCSTAEIKKLIKDATQKESDFQNTIDGKEPQQADYNGDDAAFQKDHDTWSDNSDQNKAFWSKIRKALETALVKSKGDTSGYNWMKIMYAASYQGDTAYITEFVSDAEIEKTLTGYSKLLIQFMTADVPTAFSPGSPIMDSIDSQQPDANLSDAEKKAFGDAKAANKERYLKFGLRLKPLVDAAWKKLQGNAGTGNASSSSSTSTSANYKWIEPYWEVAQTKKKNALPMTFIPSTGIDVTALYMNVKEDDLAKVDVDALEKKFDDLINANHPDLKKDGAAAVGKWTQNKEQNALFWDSVRNAIQQALAIGEAIQLNYKWVWVFLDLDYKGEALYFGEGEAFSLQTFDGYDLAKLKFVQSELGKWKTKADDEISKQSPSMFGAGTSQEQKFLDLQSQNKTRVETFYNALNAALQDAIKNAPNATSASSTATSGTGSGYQWIHAQWSPTIGGKSFSYKPGTPIPYTDFLVCTDEERKQLDGDVQTLMNEDEKLRLAAKPKASQFPNDKAAFDACLKDWLTNSQENFEFWKEARAALKTATMIKGAEKLGYKWVDIDFYYPSKAGAPPLDCTEFTLPTMSDLAQLPLASLKDLSSIALPNAKKTILDAIDVQSIANNAPIVDKVVFKTCKKSNSDHCNAFFDKLNSLVDAAIQKKTPSASASSGSPTVASNYQAVPIEWNVGGVNKSTTFTSETGVDYSWLVAQLSLDDLEDLATNDDIEDEKNKNIQAINDKEPDAADFDLSNPADKTLYDATKLDWIKNHDDATAFWQDVKDAVVLAYLIKKANAEGNYHWQHVEWDEPINSQLFTETSLPTVANFDSYTVDELDLCIDDANSQRDDLKDEVDQQTYSGNDSGGEQVFNDVKDINLKRLVDFFDNKVIPVLEQAKAKVAGVGATTSGSASNSAASGANTQTSSAVAKDPVYQWIDLVWSFTWGNMVYELIPNKTIKYDIFAKKVAKSNLQTYLTQLDQWKKEMDKKFSFVEPLESEYSSHTLYEQSHNRWSENVAQCDAFWKNARHAFTCALYLKDVKTVQYKWIAAAFSTVYNGNSIYLESTTHLGYIKNASDDVLTHIKAELPTFLNKKLQEIDAQSAPSSLKADQQSLFNKIKETNRVELVMFVNKINMAIDTMLSPNGVFDSNFLVKDYGAPQIDTQYKWIEDEWTVSGDDASHKKVSFTFKKPEEISYEKLSQIIPLHLKEYTKSKHPNNPGKKGKEYKKLIQTQKPLKKNFDIDADFEAAKEQWEANQNASRHFWKNAETAINQAIIVHNGENAGYHWVSIVWTFGNLTIEDYAGFYPQAEQFAKYSAEDLQKMLDSLEPQKVALIDTCDAQTTTTNNSGTTDAFDNAKDANKTRITGFFNALVSPLKEALNEKNQQAAASQTQTQTGALGTVSPQVNMSAPSGTTIDPPALTPSFRGKQKVEELNLIWIQMTCKQLKESECGLVEKAKGEWIAFMDANHADKSKDDGLAFWNDGLARIDALIQSKEELLKQSPDNPEGFPKDLSGLKVVGKLGGSTGAKLVEDADGNRYVMKMGGSAGGTAAADHLRSECAADAFYRACGVRVPAFKLYTDEKGNPVKLSRFMKDAQSLGIWWDKASAQDKELMRAKLREHYAIDVLVGNWDVVGTGADNIMVDANGEPWRIDNGGSLNYRAQGAPKKTLDPLAWGEDCMIDDLWTMTGNGSRIGSSVSTTIPPYYGDIDVLDMANRIMASQDGLSQNPLDYLSPEDQKAIKKRLVEFQQIANRGNDHLNNTYTREFTLNTLDHSYQYSKDGLREACSYDCDLVNQNYGWIRGGSSVSGDPASIQNNKIQTAILNAIKTVNHHNAQGGDMTPNQNTVNEALAQKPILEAALQAGEPGAQHYLDILDQIENAVKTNSVTPPNIDTTKPIFAPSGKTTVPALQSQYNSFLDYVRSKTSNDAVNFFEQCNSSQGKNSYSIKSCYTKILRLRAQGFDVRDPKYQGDNGFETLSADLKATGYYAGDDPAYYHYKNLKEAFKYFRDDHPDQYDLRYSEMEKVHAAHQIMFENLNAPMFDKQSRTIIVTRTEDESVLRSAHSGNLPAIGEKCKHARGINESHTVIDPITVKGEELTIGRVSITRCYGFYATKDYMFLGDPENEISVDTHGVPMYYVGNFYAKETKAIRSSIDALKQKLEEYEKKNP